MITCKAAYHVKKASIRPALSGQWDSGAWEAVTSVELSHFREESSSNRPRTRAKLLHSPQGINGIFRVEDSYVRCVHDSYGEPVYKDSCVEFFVKPKETHGYFNFEFNCGGTLLCSYIVDPTRTHDGFMDFVRLPEAEGRLVEIYHSMPGVVEPEIAGPVTWIIEFFLPFTLIEKYVGPPGVISGQEWKANFYKCGDETSHPHWASWSPVEELNFHMPRCFGTICFE